MNTLVPLNAMQVAEALHASELRYRRLFESAKDGILILDANTGKVADVNPFLVQLLGYTRKEFLGKAIWELGFFCDIVANKESFAELQQERYIRYEDKPLKTADGRRIDVEFVSNVYLVDHLKVIQCNIRDITDRKLIEKNLQASEQGFRTLAESMPQMVWIARSDGWNIYFNQQWVAYTGLTLEESYGHGWTAPFHPDDKQRALEAWRSAIRHSKTYSMECRLRRADGVYRWWLIRGEPVLSANGEILKWFGTCTDTEDIKRTEGILRDAKNLAETANRAKSDFLSSMSHELRTPLNAIIGFSELLADKIFGDLNAKQSKYVDYVCEAGRHLLSLINDILDLSKVESGKMVLEWSTFPLATALENSLVMVRERCMKQGIALKLDLQGPLLEIGITADERKLKQILFNLLSNAAKFTDKGGTITLGAEIREPLSPNSGPWDASVTADLHVPAFLISVADTGIGIKPEDQERIFLEFEQVNSNDSPTFEGTGLGLKLVQQFVELHGGRVWVESALGQGSTFRFTIPIRSEKERAHHAY